MSQTPYERAIVRNLHEVGAARFERAALVALIRTHTPHDWDFFRVAHNALFNDLIAHSIRVLDRNRKSALFWYLHRCNSGAISALVSKRRMTWQTVETVTDKLKPIRDLTHFHIDVDAVEDPRAVWKAAGLSGNILGQALTYVWTILLHLHELQFGHPFEAPAYDGSDVAPIIAAAQRAGAIPS